VKALNDRRVTILSFDLLPRISRAQYMDALSSQATVSGYRAALKGATVFDRFFPTAHDRRGHDSSGEGPRDGRGRGRSSGDLDGQATGCQGRAYDVRSAAKEEAESAGAVFVKLGVTADAAGGYAREN
jgi:NAD(P) transhydrogenase subunit alpha